MITNGEVTVNRRRRVGDFEHNEAVVKLSFTMDGITNEEEFRCRVMDQAVKLAMLGLSTPNAASAADTTSPVPAPERTAGSRRRATAEPSTAAPVPEALATMPATVSLVHDASLVPDDVVTVLHQTMASLTPASPVEVTVKEAVGTVGSLVIGGPPTPPAAAPIVAPPALGNGALNGATASPSIPPNGSPVATPIVIGAPPSPPTVPVPAAVASPTDAPVSSDAAGGGRYADKLEFQKGLLAQVTRINGAKPGQGGLLVNQVIARYVAPPNGASAIPVEQREAFMAEVSAIQ